MTGIVYDALTGDWAITVDTATGEQCEGHAATAQEAAARLEEAVARWARHEALHNWQTARAIGARHEACRVLDGALSRSVAPQRAIAQEKGLNPRADEEMRAAIGCYWSIDVASRAQLTAGQWLVIGDAVKLGALSW